MRFLDKQPRARGADLALAEEDAHEHALERGFEIGVGEDDVRRFAAELERDLLQVARRGADERRPTSVEPVKVILSTSSWCGERRAGGFAVAGDDVEHAFGEAGFEEQLASRSATSDVSSAGLRMIVLPVASAGAALYSGMVSG